MTEFPELNTERLKLRKIKLSDADSLLKYMNNKKISENILNIPYPYTEESVIARMNFILQGFKNKERYVFSITLKDPESIPVAIGTGAELIGQIGLHLVEGHDRAEIGYWVGEPFWGKGIATEACAAILKFGFEILKLNKIYATHFTENPSSGKVLINNKMIKEAELKDQYKSNGVYKSVDQYRLTKQEYLTMYNV
jgi:ribosomal-protein-alanine N-acetyltransferase